MKKYADSFLLYSRAVFCLIFCLSALTWVAVGQPITGPEDPVVISLWDEGAPGSENRKGEKEQAKDYWVKNIHNPNLTIYRPEKGKENGAAVVICPGGGHRLLVITAEGEDAARYFTSLGMTAFVLKYRLFREENSPYTEADCRADGLRAIRKVRSLADQYHLDPDRIGIMGFSAGGELAAWTAFAEAPANQKSEDPVERFSGHPNFQILIYPGPLAVEDVQTSVMPPAFLLAANDDRCCSGPILELTKMYREANVPVEMHLYAKGDHAFNMGKRSDLQTIHGWPDRLTDWLKDNGWIPGTK